MEHITHPFPPVVDENCRILILGSFPSVRSREDGFFYGHPQNRFWRMLAAVFNEETPTSIPDKKAFLLRHRIALWDVIASCMIEGSSDASVKDAVPVDIRQVTDTTKIEQVLCNGGLAGKLYQQHLQGFTGLRAVILPSTSPANAAWSLSRLVEAWKPQLTDTVYNP